MITFNQTRGEDGQEEGVWAAAVHAVKMEESPGNDNRWVSPPPHLLSHS